MRFNMILSHYHIQQHHQCEANSEKDGTEIGMLTIAGFRYEFLYNNVKHSSCGKSQHVGEHRYKQSCQHDHENGTKRLGDATQTSQ